MDLAVQMTVQVQNWEYRHSPIPYRLCQYPRGKRMPAILKAAAILPWNVPPRRIGKTLHTTAVEYSLLSLIKPLEETNGLLF